MKQRLLKYLPIVVFCAVLVFVVLNLLLGFRAYLNGQTDYESMPVSDWFINYEGGFVRRGMIGQLLLWAYQLCPHSITHTIIVIYITGLSLLVWLVVRIFRAEGWSPYIVIFPACIFFSFLGARRDYWALAIAYCIFLCYSRYLAGRRSTLCLFICTLLAILTILIHEASFFFTIPVLLAVPFFAFLRCKAKVSLSALLPVLLATSAMIIVSLFKGNADTATAIWQSWADCFSRYPLSDHYPQMGSAVAWLDKDTAYALDFHIHRFWLASFMDGVPSWPFNLYVLLAIYYLVTRLDTISLHFWPLHPLDHVLLSNVMLLQLLCLLPMFGFLSCDMGRVVMYWSVSSLFICHLLGSYLQFPGILGQFSSQVQTVIANSAFLSNKWTYLAILITIPIAETVGSNIQSCFAFVPCGWRLTFWQEFFLVFSS